MTPRAVCPAQLGNTAAAFRLTLPPSAPLIGRRQGQQQRYCTAKNKSRLDLRGDGLAAAPGEALPPTLRDGR